VQRHRDPECAALRHPAAGAWVCDNVYVLEPENAIIGDGELPQSLPSRSNIRQNVQVVMLGINLRFSAR
jgi:hypothetical protein